MDVTPLFINNQVGSEGVDYATRLLYCQHTIAAAVTASDGHRYIGCVDNSLATLFSEAMKRCS